jgi:hypothetical protein
MLYRKLRCLRVQARELTMCDLHALPPALLPPVLCRRLSRQPYQHHTAVLTDTFSTCVCAEVCFVHALRRAVQHLLAAVSTAACSADCCAARVPKFLS